MHSTPAGTMETRETKVPLVVGIATGVAVLVVTLLILILVVITVVRRRCISHQTKEITPHNPKPLRDVNGPQYGIRNVQHGNQERCGDQCKKKTGSISNVRSRSESPSIQLHQDQMQASLQGKPRKTGSRGYSEVAVARSPHLQKEGEWDYESLHPQPYLESIMKGINGNACKP